MANASRLDARVLIASEDRALLLGLSELLREHAPDVLEAGSRSVLDAVNRHPGLRLLIICESGLDSAALDLLQTVKELRDDLAVLLISAHPTIEHAAESIRRGAEDFVPVPYSTEIVRKKVARILEAAELRDRVARELQTWTKTVDDAGIAKQ